MLILASNSPRRKEILKMLGYDFIVCPSDADENIKPMCPEDTVKELSKIKALSIKRGSEDTVIGSDTVVYLNGKILGKPSNTAEAKEMLLSLSGKKHTVYTGVTVISDDKIKTEAIKAEVFFRKISEAEIDFYISTKEPMDKAGAYGIQGKGAAYIEKIEGDFFAVMGLPACYISKILGEFKIFPNI